MFDAINAPQKPTAAKIAALPPKAETREEPKPAEVAPATPAVEAPKEADVKTEVSTAPPAPPALSVPESTVSPGAPILQPLPAEKTLTRPAITRPALARPSEPVPPATSPAARPEARELTKAPQTSLAPTSPLATKRAPASRPLTQAAERQFALQMGVFSNVANAEDLRAKLELNGIPATVEARVHAGPFASREEADAARAKLKELGLDGGLMITMKK
jgi:DedD protein